MGLTAGCSQIILISLSLLYDLSADATVVGIVSKILRQIHTFEKCS